jgi:hypothetical protein
MNSAYRIHSFLPLPILDSEFWILDSKDKGAIDE